MKKIVLSIAALASFAIANAQDFKPTSGKVALEDKETSLDQPHSLIELYP